MASWTIFIGPHLLHKRAYFIARTDPLWWCSCLNDMILPLRPFNVRPQFNIQRVRVKTWNLQILSHSPSLPSPSVEETNDYLAPSWKQAQLVPYMCFQMWSISLLTLWQLICIIFSPPPPPPTWNSRQISGRVCPFRKKGVLQFICKAYKQDLPRIWKSLRIDKNQWNEILEYLHRLLPSKDTYIYLSNFWYIEPNWAKSNEISANICNFLISTIANHQWRNASFTSLCALHTNAYVSIVLWKPH